MKLNTGVELAREGVRNMKRALRRALEPNADAREQTVGRECALALLARSIDFGHGRLAVLRLLIAVEAGADVPPAFWNYCARAAAKAAELQELYVRAAKRAAHPTPRLNEGISIAA